VGREGKCRLRHTLALGIAPGGAAPVAAAPLLGAPAVLVAAPAAAAPPAELVGSYWLWRTLGHTKARMR